MADDSKAEVDTTQHAAEEESSKVLSLVSQEGESFSVPIGVAKMSELVKTMIDGMILDVPVGVC